MICTSLLLAGYNVMNYGQMFLYSMACASLALGRESERSSDCPSRCPQSQSLSICRNDRYFTLSAGDQFIEIFAGKPPFQMCDERRHKYVGEKYPPNRMFRTVKIPLEPTTDPIGTVSVLNEICQRVLEWGHPNHRVVKGMVNEHYDILVFEDLTGIRAKKRNRDLNKKLGTWSFHQLLSFVECKAEALGKNVMVIV